MNQIVPWIQFGLDALLDAETPPQVIPSRTFARTSSSIDSPNHMPEARVPIKRHSMFSTTADISPSPKKLIQTISKITQLKRQSSLEDINILQIPGIDALFSIKHIIEGPKLNDVLSLFDAIIEDQFAFVDIVINRITSITSSEQVKCYMFDDARQHLVDLSANTLVSPQGCIKSCIHSGQVMLVNDVGQQSEYSACVDNLGLESVQNILLVPVFNAQQEVKGIIAAANGDFDDESVHFTKFISLILLFVFDQQNKTAKDKGRRLKMLLHWCKQVFLVSVNSQYKQDLAKKIIYSVSTNATFEQNLDLSMEVIAAMSTSEGCKIFFRDQYSTEVVRYANGVYEETAEGLDAVDKIIEQGLPLRLPKQTEHENALIVPIIFGSKIVGAIKVWNKRDDTLKYYKEYTTSDENMILDFSRVIGKIHMDSESDHNLEIKDLQTLIRRYTNAMNSLPLVNTIRSAVKTLLDCDRGTVFTRRGDHLHLQVQGHEQEVPLGFSTPIGVGIVGHVAKTGIAENIADAHEDPRFNTDLDRRTGYRTCSILCMPVFNSNHEVIAVLEMINKKSGKFDEEDIGILEMFCEMASSALQNLDIFNKNMEERLEYISILTSMQEYILVFDVQGHLSRCNQKIVEIFGIDEKEAREKPYYQWIPRSQLTADLTEILKKPHNNIRRMEQTLKVQTNPMARKLSRAPNPTVIVGNSSKKKKLTINYNIMPLTDFETQEVKGLVLIIEDVTSINQMKQKVAKMASQLKHYKSKEEGAGVSTNKPLQQVISNLNALQLQEADESDKALIQEAINILKAGNVERAQVSLGAGIRPKLAKFLNKEFTPSGAQTPNQQEETPTIETSSWKVMQQKALVGTVNLELIREWNLNVWEIEDHMPYIYTMFTDFDLIERFQVKAQKFVNFVSEIRGLYETHKNPYHNFYHGFNVQHVVYFLLASTPAASLFSPLDILALMISALCHDVSHTGRTNAFEVSSESQLALLYHDVSVLENHHAAQTFFTLAKEECNVLENLRQEDKKIVRKLIIESILATDMSKHFVSISDLNSRFDELHESPIGSKEGDKDHIAGLLVHCADLSNPTKNFSLCNAWSKRVNEEFSAQVESEKALGLPVTEFMLRLDVDIVYFKNELNFNKFVVKPLWECIDKWLNPNLSFAMTNFEQNLEIFQKELDRLSSEQ